VIRYISVRVDEDLKRMEKMKAARLKKIRKKTAGASPESAAPAI